MGLFGRKETLNEQLLREAGLDPAQMLGEAPPEPPANLEPPKSVLATAGLPDGSGVGPSEWGACVTTTAPGLSGNRIRFTTLPGGDVLIEEEEGNADVSALADAVEGDLRPPYKAFAARQHGDLWAVGAKRIQVAEFEFADGDKLELSEHDGERELRVDGEPGTDAAVPAELEQLGERAGPDFSVTAERIDGDFWEVRVSPL